MSNRVVPKWLAGALIAVLALGAISAINAAQAAPVSHPLVAPANSSVQSKPPASDKPAPPTTTPDPCAVGWSEQSVYPINILGEATAAQGGNIYSFGGTSDGSTITANSYKYNGTGWSAIASLPNPIYLASVVSDGTYIYILNGATTGIVITNTLTRYDPVANTYNMLASPVYTSAAQAAVYLNGKIYRIGGVGAGSSTLNSVEVYNVAGNTWSTAANYPTSIALESAVTIGGYIYTAGGNTSNSTDALTNKTYRYNPTTNSWEDGAIDDLAQPREAAAADVFNGQFLIAGGAITGTGMLTFTNTALSWNPSGNVWTNLPNMIVPRALNSGATLGGAFYSVGGADFNSAPTNDNQRYAPNGCTTPTPGPTATVCPVPFTDIGGNIFYGAIVNLYCRGVVNGTDPTHYSPAGTSTRGQFAKVVVLGFGTPFYTPATPDFTDVPPSYFAYTFIESGFHNGILSGFDPAGCTAHGATYPCYLPNIPITRGQLTKLVVGAAHYPLFTPTGGTPTFSDVPPSNVFFVSIETAHNKGVINGYPDGTFRPNNNIRRDEMAQIVYKGVITP